jgi:hypothetical protein
LETRKIDFTQNARDKQIKSARRPAEKIGKGNDLKKKSEKR